MIKIKDKTINDKNTHKDTQKVEVVRDFYHNGTLGNLCIEIKFVVL